MATVLFAWELGVGLGHCANIRPLVEAFARDGHDVHVALRDVALASRAFGDLPITIHQAPHLVASVPNPISIPCTFAHILHNTGFATADNLDGLVRAWRGLYQTTNPELVLFEHSPSALLASYTLPVRRAIVGTGFCCPRDESPLPNLRPWEKVDRAQLDQNEELVKRNMNDVLQKYRHPGWERVTQMYASVDANILLCFAEFDHYGIRKNAQYYGSWPLEDGASEINWPSGTGPKVFCYLKPFATFANLVSLLRDLRTRAVIYAPDIPAGTHNPLASKGVAFIRARVNVRASAKQCDLAILNGNVSTASTFLLSGVPSFHIPLFLEQAIFARRLVKFGAGMAADPDRPERIGARLASMIYQDPFRRTAAQFAKKYESFSAKESIDRAYETVAGLL